jgi:hypothetical protein
MKAVSGKMLCKIVERNGWELKRISYCISIECTGSIETAQEKTPTNCGSFRAKFNTEN